VTVKKVSAIGYYDDPWPMIKPRVVYKNDIILLYYFNNLDDTPIGHENDDLTSDVLRVQGC
jgi:hypothetical protein